MKRPRTGLVLRIIAILAALLLAAVITQQALSSSSSTTAITGGETPKRSDTLTQDDGLLPDAATVYDDHHPGIANLDPDLLSALRTAADTAGIPFTVNSGWRSQRYQEHLIADGVEQYGSAEEAARWVGSPTGSSHVTGNAVDLGWAAADWIATNGAAYGLCQTYLNEGWHYELRPAAPTQGCPAAYIDAAHDPRMN